MTNRLPLPISVINELVNISHLSLNDLGLKNLTYNIASYLLEYNYAEAIKLLVLLQQDYTNLIDYKKSIRKIKQAQNRYNNI